MAIDTKAKRASALAFQSVWLTLPPPDGTIGQGDRQNAARTYAGILAEEAVAVVAETRGGGHPYQDRKGRRRYRREKRELDTAIAETLEAAYRAAMGEAPELPKTEVAEIRAVANRHAPQSAQRKIKLPPVAKVDFESMAEDSRALKALARFIEQERDNEAAAFLLLVA